MSDRPEYRILYTSFANDADVHALSGLAFKALILLKLSLPAIGLGVMYPSMLCDQVGCSREELDAILAELEAPKPNRDRGWIMRDRNIVWVVNALACEPGLSVVNVNHVKYVRRLIASVDQRSPVVSAFRECYREWIEGDTKPIRKGSRKPSSPPRDPIPKASESLGDPTATATTTPTNKSGDLDQERGESPPAAASTAAAPPAPLFASLTELLAASATVAAWWKRYYPRELADRARRDDVGQQLLATLNGGAVLAGERIQAYSLARLEARCRDVLTEGVRDRDKAIVVLLKKLGDTSDGSAPGQVAAVQQERERATDDENRGREIVEANAWLEERVDVELAITARLEVEFPHPVEPGDDVLAISRSIARDALVLRAYRARASPDPDTAKNPATP